MYLFGVSETGISVDWVIGADEVTAWMWSESPDPLTVRFSLHEWAKIEKAARKHCDGDIAAYVTRVITADLKKHKAVLSD